MSELLRINDLHVGFPTDDGIVRAVDRVSLTVSQGETVAIVGESGSGKTVTSLSVMGLHKKGSAEMSGSISVAHDGGFLDVVTASEEEIRSMRGRSVAMIFQDPMSALHPYYKIGDQLAEAWQRRSVGPQQVGGLDDVALRLADRPCSEQRRPEPTLAHDPVVEVAEPFRQLVELQP